MAPPGHPTPQGCPGTSPGAFWGAPPHGKTCKKREKRPYEKTFFLAISSAFMLWSLNVLGDTMQFSGACAFWKDTAGTLCRTTSQHAGSCPSVKASHGLGVFLHYLAGDHSNEGVGPFTSPHCIMGGFARTNMLPATLVSSFTHTLLAGTLF